MMKVKAKSQIKVVYAIIQSTSKKIRNQTHTEVSVSNMLMKIWSSMITFLASHICRNIFW